MDDKKKREILKTYIHRVAPTPPSVDGFYVYMFENEEMTMDEMDSLVGEYRGLINNYARKQLIYKATNSTRNSMTFVQLLRHYDAEPEVITNNEKVVINIGNDSENTILDE